MFKSNLPNRSHRLPLLAVLLSLLLYLGGGLLAAGHIHDDEHASDDHACGICLLAAATVAGLAASLSIPTSIAAGLCFQPLRLLSLRGAAVTARARAPPALLI